MNLLKKLKKLFKTKEKKKWNDCGTCYNSIDFFENPEIVSQNKETQKIKSIHVHHYTPWFSITETLTDDDETPQKVPTKSRKVICKKSAHSNVKTYHYRHYESNKKKKSDSKISKFQNENKISDSFDVQETYDNLDSPKNVGFIYLKKKHFLANFNPNIVRIF